MLPRKLHLEQINRFHDTLEELNKRIDAEKDLLKKGELCMEYFELNKLWIEIDNFIEMTIKHNLDIRQASK